MASGMVPVLVGAKNFGKNDSPWVSVLNICNTVIGAGVLSFPFGFRQTGLVGGIFFTSIVWIVEVFTLCLLVRVADKCNSHSYQGLVHTVMGPGMAVVTSITSLMFLVGAMISYFIITGDVFTPIFQEKIGDSTVLANRNVVLVCFAVLVILPLSLQTTLKALKYSSTISVFMLSYLTVALVSIGITHILQEGFPENAVIFQAGMNTFILWDIAVFAFECHIQVIPIFAELTEHPQPFFRREPNVLEERLLDEEFMSELEGPQRSERVKRMDGIIFLSMSICFIGFCLVGEFGYLLFQNVESDVLSSFGSNNIFMNVARIGMAVVSLVCYPVQHFPARSILNDVVMHVTKASNPFSWTRHVLITLGLVGSTLGVAMCITDLGDVFSIVGATGGVLVVFILPGVFLIMGSHRLSPPRQSDHFIEEEDGPKPSTRSCGETCSQVFGGSSIILFGVVLFSATVYVTTSGLVRG